MQSSARLFGFWRSLGTYRIRIALALKGLSYDETSINLLKGEQFQGEVARLNPQHSLPIIQLDDATLTQSLAILEYLEECYPTPALLPSEPLDRAWVRSFSLITVADSHPLTVPRVRKKLSSQFNATDAQVEEWANHWSYLGLQAMEARLLERSHTSRLCFSDSPGFADIALASQVAGAGFFGVDIGEFPAVVRVMNELNTHDEFTSTAPLVKKAEMNL